VPNISDLHAMLLGAFSEVFASKGKADRHESGGGCSHESIYSG
jgi:hypothetical protein